MLLNSLSSPSFRVNLNSRIQESFIVINKMQDVVPLDVTRKTKQKHILSLHQEEGKQQQQKLW